MLVEVTFGILGRTALRIGGDLQEGWGAPRLHAVLATLLVHAGRSVPIGTLIEWSWGEETAGPRDPVSTFHTYATRIRKWLLRLSSPVAELRTGKGSYRLDVADKAIIDYCQFRTLVTQARACARGRDPQRAVEYAQHALDLSRGRPLDDLSSEPAQAWRTRFIHDEWLPANTILLEGLLAINEPGQALARLNDLQVDHPDDVGLATLRLSALHGLSRSADATTYYFSVRRRLLDDADEQAADHLRRHHEGLRVQVSEPEPAQLMRPRQLRHDIADFVGREDLLRALDRATTKPTGEISNGVVILDGIAGVGKTALAVHWGHLARHRFPDGDFYINLNGFSDSAMVSQSTVVDDFLIALGYPPDANLTQRSRELLLSRLLANRRTLVILDNARNTDHIKDLVALLTGSLVLVTSRQRLTTLSATTGARRVRVEPMRPTEATDLLSIRLGTDRHLDPTDRRHLVELCGGLPLMITVLADHVATSGTAHVTGFAQRFDRRRLIADIGDDGDGSAIAHTFLSWSYDRLGPAEQRLFRLLGLHHGPEVNVDVACACDDRTPEETKRSFGSLVGAHLLERPEVLDRYAFHDVIQEFARYCAERDESPESRAAAERRMSGHYLATAIAAHRTLYPGQLTAPEDPGAADAVSIPFATAEQAKSWFDRERSNLMAAIRHAGGRGHHDHAWRLADTVATFLDRHGSYEDSRAIREIAIASATIIGDREALASSQAGLAMVLTILGDHGRARHFLELALRFAVETGNERGQGSTLHQLGRLEMASGDPVAAIELFQRCLDLNQRINDHEGLCWTHFRIGEAFRVVKEHDKALVHLNQCQFHAQRIDDKSAHAASLAEIGLVHRDRGDHPAATAYCEQALKLVDAMPIRDPAATTRICTALAEINHALRDVSSAISYGLRAAMLARRTHDATAEAHARDVLGDIHFGHGDSPEAVHSWTQAAILYQRLGNQAQAAAVHLKISQAT
jgi:tetratricopeptide (TPR) repeat protein